MAYWRGRSSTLRAACPALMVWASGCALFCPPVPDPVGPEATAPAAPEEPDVVVMRVEDELCSPELAAPAPQETVGAPQGTLTVSWGNDPQELTLEVRGARLGRVLEEISRRTDQAVVGVGAPADVRVWATVRSPRPWRVLVEQLAASVGAYVIDHGEVMSVVDEVGWHAHQQSVTSLAPVEVGAFPSANPEEEMAILVEMGLSCRGYAVWRRGDGEVYLSDRAPGFAQGAALANWLSGPAEEPLALDPRERPHTPGPLACEESGAASDDTLGAAILEAAAASRQEAIVGCGGARRIAAVRTSRSTPEALARATGLGSRPQGNVWATPAALSVPRLESGPSPVNEVVVARYASEDPEKDAAFVRAMFSGVRAVPWASRGAILVMTTRDGHRAVKATLEGENAS